MQGGAFLFCPDGICLCPLPLSCFSTGELKRFPTHLAKLDMLSFLNTPSNSSLIMNARRVPALSHILPQSLPITSRCCGLKESRNSLQTGFHIKKVTDDLLYRFVFFIVQKSGFYSQHTALMCFCLALDTSGFWMKVLPNTSFVKLPMCNLVFFFETLARRHRFNSTIITWVLVLCSAACKYWGRDTFFCCFVSLLQQMELKWTNNWD